MVHFVFKVLSSFLLCFLTCYHLVLTSILAEISRFLRPVRGQVISTTPLPVGKRPLTNASFNDDFEYLIARPDGRVVLGGCRWRSGTPKRQVRARERRMSNIRKKKVHSFPNPLLPFIALAGGHH